MSCYFIDECFSSKEYQEIMNKRIESVDARAVIVEDQEDSPFISRKKS